MNDFYVASLFPVINGAVWVWSGMDGAVQSFFSVEKGGILVLAAVAEELFFRGFLLDWFLLRRKSSVLFSAVGVSIWFAVLHGLNWLSSSHAGYVAMQVVCAFGVSMLWNYFYWRYHSVLPSVAAHVLTNLTALLVTGANLDFLSGGLYLLGGAVSGFYGYWGVQNKLI